MNPYQTALETTKEIKIVPPKGFEIDREHSTLECIKFKPIAKRWRDNKNELFEGYFISNNCRIVQTALCSNNEFNGNVFTTKKQAKSAIAMAYISQIMANDERFGGPITDEEWADSTLKYCIMRHFNRRIAVRKSQMEYYFLAFHSKEQRDLFIKENEDLIKDYLMLD